jgi:hypothetical protein
MTNTVERYFTAFLTVVGLFAAAVSSTFNPTARSFPLVFGIILFLFAGLLFLGELFPQNKKLDFVRGRGILNEANEAGGASTVRERDDSIPAAPWSLVIIGFASIVTFVLLMWLTSYLVAVPLYVVGSIVVVSKGKIVPALLAAAVVEVMVFLIFEVVL